MKHLFFGGIHPAYRKELSANANPADPVIPRQVIIPLSQHIGAPCKPLVKVGDKVLRGQKIGDGEGLCVPVHASVSGTVTAVEPRPHPNGQMVNAIVIDNDFQDTTIEYQLCQTPTEELDADQILHTIREAGIVGMGGAAFPGNVKALSSMGHVNTLIANACECEPYITADDTLLRTNPEHVLDGAAFPGNVKALSSMGHVNTLIANACECEPYITADDTLLRTNPEHVLEGMMILRHVLKPERVVLAVEDNKAAAIEKIKFLSASFPEIEILILPTRYPQGSEKQLIQSVTGREVPPGQLPVSVGCAVFNVSTFAAIYRAVRLGMPLIQRIVTISGEAITSPQNFVVRIGTPFRDLIEAANGLNDRTERVISGGPMMGIAQSDLSVSAAAP